MKEYRKGVMVVLYKITSNKIYYAVFERILGWKGFEFVKGNIENEESPLDSARREVNEEAGIEPDSLEDTGFNVRYFFAQGDNTVVKTLRVFMADAGSKNVRADGLEHRNVDFLQFDDAVKRLTFDNTRDVLKRVNSVLMGRIRETSLCLKDGAKTMDFSP